MQIYEQIEKLILFGIQNGFIDPLDEVLVRNKILEALKLEDYNVFDKIKKEEFLKYVSTLEFPCEILDNITEWAGENGIIKENILVFKDLLNSQLMGIIVPRTSEITKEFWGKYNNKKEDATK